MMVVTETRDTATIPMDKTTTTLERVVVVQILNRKMVKMKTKVVRVIKETTLQVLELTRMML